MTDEDVGDHQVQVRTPDADGMAILRVVQPERLLWRVMLEVGPAEEVGEGWNLFDALRDLRVLLDRKQISIGIVGSLPNAAVSGMLADMGEGRRVYLLTMPRTSDRPQTARTLAQASLDDVGTVAAQDGFQKRWFD